jgi:hypothetical protein
MSPKLRRPIGGRSEEDSDEQQGVAASGSVQPDAKRGGEYESKGAYFRPKARKCERVRKSFQGNELRLKRECERKEEQGLERDITRKIV